MMATLPAYAIRKTRPVCLWRSQASTSPAWFLFRRRNLQATVRVHARSESPVSTNWSDITRTWDRCNMLNLTGSRMMCYVRSMSNAFSSSPSSMTDYKKEKTRKGLFLCLVDSLPVWKEIKVNIIKCKHNLKGIRLAFHLIV